MFLHRSRARVNGLDCYVFFTAMPLQNAAAECAHLLDQVCHERPSVVHVFDALSEEQLFADSRGGAWTGDARLFEVEGSRFGKRAVSYASADRVLLLVPPALLQRMHHALHLVHLLDESPPLQPELQQLQTAVAKASARAARMMVQLPVGGAPRADHLEDHRTAVAGDLCDALNAALPGLGHRFMQALYPELDLSSCDEDDDAPAAMEPKWETSRATMRARRESCGLNPFTGAPTGAGIAA